MMIFQSESTVCIISDDIFTLVCAFGGEIQFNFNG